MIKRIFNLFKGRKSNSEEPPKGGISIRPEDRHYFYKAWGLNQTYCSALTNSGII